VTLTPGTNPPPEDPRPAQALVTPLQSWNPDRLGEIAAAVGEDGLCDLLQLFHADARLALAEVTRAVADGDAVAVAHTLDALKGAAANLGFASLATLAGTLSRVELGPAIPCRLSVEIARAATLPATRNVPGRPAR
jgi:hypothetical protein